jgi:hypothetical protein
MQGYFGYFFKAEFLPAKEAEVLRIKITADGGRRPTRHINYWSPGKMRLLELS